jgi:hypothetical protein
MLNSNVKPNGLLNDNLKVTCELCGFLAPNTESLKFHMSIHNGKQLTEKWIGIIFINHN